MSEPYDPNQPRPELSPPSEGGPSQAPPPVSPPAQPPAKAPTSPPAQPPASPYAAAPPANPYGDGPAYPGSKPFVEQYFGQVAGFGSRVAALIIDSLISMIGIIPAVVGAVMLVIGAPDVDAFGDTIEGSEDVGVMVIGGLLIMLGVLISIGIQIWNRIFKMGRTGQSVGKKAMGLMLINDQTGQPIGALQAFVRELVSGLVNQVLYISYLWMLWDDNRQTLADKVVHSTVIRVAKP